LIFPMVGRETFNIEATLAEKGRFGIELLSTKAQVEVQNVRVEDGIGKAEVVRKVKPMSAEDLRQRRDEKLEELAGKEAMDKAHAVAKDAKSEDMRRFLLAFGLGDPGGDDKERLKTIYARAKAFENKSELLRKKLGEAASANPRRFSPQDRDAWKAMKAGELYIYYRKVLQTELAEEHLNKCGLDYDRSTRNAAEKVVPMFLALHSLMTSQPPEDAEDQKAVKDAMSGGTAAQLRQAITVDLRLRLYSDAEGTDPNGQWFNAQHVACRANGVSSIRVEGTLDPAKGDSVDWWIIDRWDAANIQFTTSTEDGVQFDPPKVENGAAQIRVTSKKAARYWFEMRTDKGDMKVVVYESFIPAESKFPY
jgi:hypothetical protein